MQKSTGKISDSDKIFYFSFKNKQLSGIKTTIKGNNAIFTKKGGGNFKLQTSKLCNT